MCDIFLQHDINRLLYNKFLVIIGDSVQRAIYKDFVLLLQKNCYLSNSQLRTKGEGSHCSDVLIEGGKKGEMTNGTNYREVRQYQTDTHLVRFYFVTRCYGEYMETILADLKQDPYPDVVIMNSCLWDITRYGANAVPMYKKNLEKLFDRFDEVLSDKTLVLWNTTLPVSSQIRGGFLIPEVEFMNDTLRLDVMEANFYARQVVSHHGYDILDLHYHLRRQIHRRAADGVHWDMTAHRRITNLILTHMADSWGVGLPQRVDMVNSIMDGSNSVGRFQTAGGDSDLHPKPLLGISPNVSHDNRIVPINRQAYMHSTPMQQQRPHQRSMSYEPRPTYMNNNSGNIDNQILNIAANVVNQFIGAIQQQPRQDNDSDWVEYNSNNYANQMPGYGNNVRHHPYGPRPPPGSRRRF